jgi:transposase-like protein
MANSVLSAPQFQNEDAAFEYVESHLWPRGPVCPHCGEREKIGRLQGKTTRAGLRKCYACRKPFTVRIGSIFEDSHFPLHLWLQVIHLMCASKKGISTRQVQRMFQCSMKTAWHLTHRIRHAMSDSSEAGPLGGAGKVVEVDETYFGNLPPEKAPLRKGLRTQLQARYPFAGRAWRRSSLVLRPRDQGPGRGSHRSPARRQGKPPAHRRTPHVLAGWRRIRRARGRQSFQEGVRPVRGRPSHNHQHRRRLLLGLQARHARRLPAVQRASPAPLPCRINSTSGTTRASHSASTISSAPRVRSWAARASASPTKQLVAAPKRLRSMSDVVRRMRDRDRKAKK